VRDIEPMQVNTVVFEKQTEGIEAEWACSILNFERSASFFYRKDK
jgi:hypothetical protein